MSHVKNIAIVGGSGQSGSQIVSALLSSPHAFTVTAITRSDSTSSFPSPVRVERGSYTDPSFLATALKGQDALIILLGREAPQDTQSRLIEAAAEAKVEYIFPCEFGPDSASERIVNQVSILGAKRMARDQIEKMGASWIGFVNGMWFDLSLTGGFFGVDIKNRSARLFDDGNVKISTTTLPHVGRAMAKLLALPIEKLSQYKNRFVYVQSFTASQNDMLHALYKATGTNESDWKITKEPVDEVIATSKAEIAKGNFQAFLGLLYGAVFKEGDGGNFSAKKDNEVLGLEEESIDEAVKAIVKGME